MTQTAYKYLKFVQFSELECWSVKILTQKKQSQSHLEYFTLDKFLSKNRNTTQIQDQSTYNRVTIKLYNKGLKIRDTVKGSQIGVKRQTVVNEGQFILSKIDARSGAFGIVTSELENAITTADFLSYNVKEAIVDSQYLRLFTTLKRFTDICENASTGTTGRKRISEGLFLKMSIPLPSINLQHELVRDYKAKIDQANLNRENADMLESKIESYLMDELGITITEKVKQDNGYKFLQFVNFKDLERWDWWNKPNIEKLCKYPLVQFEKTIDKIIGSVGKVPKSEFNLGSKIPIISQEKELISGYSDKEKLKIDKRNLPVIIFGDHSQTKKLIDFEFIIGADGVRLLKPNKDFNIKFYFYYLDSLKFETSTGYTRHTKYLKKEFIPLPPLDVQNKIVEQIDIWKSQIKHLKDQASELEQSAKVEFEQAIFGE